MLKLMKQHLENPIDNYPTQSFLYFGWSHQKLKRITFFFVDCKWTYTVSVNLMTTTSSDDWKFDYVIKSFGQNSMLQYFCCLGYSLTNNCWNCVIHCSIKQSKERNKKKKIATIIIIRVNNNNNTHLNDII